MALKCPQCNGNLEMFNDIDHDIGDGYYVKEDYECASCHTLFEHIVKVSPVGRSDDWFRRGEDRRLTPVKMPLRPAA